MPPDVVDLRHLQSLYSPTKVTRITFSEHTRTLHTTLLLSCQLSLVVLVSCPGPPQCQALPSRSSLPCMPTTSTTEAHCLCHPATLLLWRKKWTSANVSLWFTAKCVHTHNHTHRHTHRKTTSQRTADHACKLRLSCSWPSTLHSLLTLRSLACTTRTVGSAFCGSSQNCIVDCSLSPSHEQRLSNH